MAGPLAVKLTADISAYEKAMTRARDLAVRHAGDIASNFTGAAAKIDTAFAALTAGGKGIAALGTIPGLARSAVLAFAGFEAIKFALNETTKAAEAASKRLDELVEIANKAKNLGTGTTFLQSLTGQAKALGTEGDRLVAMLERAREAATVRIGEGTASASSTILDRLRQDVAAGNLSRTDLNRFTDADSQESRIRVILDLLDQMIAKGRQTAALDLARTMFGADFETKLRTGVDIIGAMRKALDGLAVGQDGRIVPPEEIARAEALKARMEDISRQMETALVPLNRDIALWQQQQLAGWVDMKEQLAQVVVLAGNLYSTLQSVGDAMGRLGSSKPFVALRDWMDSMGLIDREGVARMERMLNGGAEADKPAVPKDADAGGPLKIAIKPKADTSRSLPSLSPSKGASETDEIERFVNQLQKSAAAIKAEADAFYKSNAEKRVAIELAKANEIASAAGKTVTDAQATAIRKAATEASNYRDKLADLEQAQRQTADLARTLGNALSESFGDAILEGKSFGSILEDLEKQLVRMALRAVFTGEGPLAGLLGTAPAASAGSNAVGGLVGGLGRLFGLGFAEGGHVSGPGTGTSDSIMARLSNGEFVVNARAASRHRDVLEAINSDRVPRFATGGIVGAVAPPGTAKSVAGASAPNVVTIAPTINLTASGGTPAQNAELADQVGKQLEGAMRGLVASEIRTYMRPNGLLNR